MLPRPWPQPPRRLGACVLEALADLVAATLGRTGPALAALPAACWAEADAPGGFILPPGLIMLCHLAHAVGDYSESAGAAAAARGPRAWSLRPGPE
ncbi:hypothetical protein AK812_SmicGene3138 [Symbiodinium microadriaticum]|uniref:Uncharacterized protein n=1 Tax=Symbiodinium microadriaticum TaxID=2951 RepID=A0A1Q9EZN2_SYMMI|nr:hypothetical protein AK812_SmicGene3138 [Symbiodinium microadriaticum]